MKKLLCSALAGLALSATALADDFDDASAVEAAVSIEFDKFEQTASFKAPAIRIMRPGNSYWHVIFLRGYAKKGKPPFDLHIYVDTHYTDSRYTVYRQAFDDKGKKLTVSNIDHDVISCSSNDRCIFEEVFSIDVTKAYLESRMKADEIEFKVDGKRDYMTFTIPGPYIKGFLNAIKNAKL